jgi:hypothetical protein
MAFDEALADRVRNELEARDGITEKRMFGGIAFLLDGKMAVGVIEDELVVRLGEEDAAKALAEEGVREMDFTGRPMKGWVFVDPEKAGGEDGFAEWVDAGVAYAASLPAKQR